MGSITSFSIQPSIISSGGSIMLDCLVTKNGTVEYKISGEIAKFSNNQSSIQVAVSKSKLNQTVETLAGPKGLVRVNAYFIDEKASKKPYTVKII